MPATHAHYCAFMASPSPYKTIAVASTFSPRFVQVLSEAKRMRQRFGSELSAIYVGECSEETVQKFRDIFAKLKQIGRASCRERV